MQIILSPAKSLNFEDKIDSIDATEIIFSEKAKKLIKLLRQYTPQDLQKSMSISEKLAITNYNRFKAWNHPFTCENSKPALYAFTGEVYNGLNAKTLKKEALEFTQNHLTILSGLYGILRPMDKIMPYRLEMNTKLENYTTKNLYEFWGNDLTEYINKRLKQDDGILVNLASNEYFKALNKTHLKATKIITPIFKEYKNEKLTLISIYAKKARGLLARFIIDNNITDPQQIKLFDKEGYFYDSKMSKENEWLFTR